MDVIEKIFLNCDSNKVTIWVIIIIFLYYEVIIVLFLRKISSHSSKNFTNIINLGRRQQIKKNEKNFNMQIITIIPHQIPKNREKNHTLACSWHFDNVQCSWDVIPGRKKIKISVLKQKRKINQIHTPSSSSSSTTKREREEEKVCLTFHHWHWYLPSRCTGEKKIASKNISI